MKRSRIPSLGIERRRFFTALKLGLATVGILLLAIGIRQIRSTDGFVIAQEGSTFPCIEGDPILGHRFRPNCKGEAIRLGKKTPIRINSIGLRGGEIPKKRKGERRILLLGNSGLFGVGQEEGSTTSAIVEKSLTKARRENVTVINGGVEGYFALHHYLLLPRLLRAVQPDMVVLVLGSQDGFFKDLVTLTACSRGPDGLPLTCSRNPADHLPAWIGPWIAESPKNFFKAYTFSLFWDRLMLSWSLWPKRPAKQMELMASPFVPLIKAMARESESRGARFHVFDAMRVADNSIYIGSFLDIRIARALQWLTPKIEVAGNAVHSYLPSQGIRCLTFSERLLKLRSGQSAVPPEQSIFSLSSDKFHFASDGTQEFAEAVAKTLAPLVSEAHKRP